MARTTEKKTTTKASPKTAKPVKNSELKVSVPKKRESKKTEETNSSEVASVSSAPKTKIITKKYMYAVLVVLALIGVLFTASRMWVVAWVDNKPISKFELYSLLEKRDDGKTAEELIVERLLRSEAQKQKQSVSKDEIDAEVKKIEDSQGGAEQLDQILTLQKLSRDDFRKLVELQLLKQKLFGAGINISDDEVKKYIEDNKASIPAEMLNNPQSSEAAKLKENVQDQLKQLKVNDNFNNWLTQTLASSRVVKN